MPACFRKFLLLALLLTGLLALARLAAAQEPAPEYRIDLNRDFGYGAGANVRGNFSAKVFGDLDAVASVVYYIDGAELGRSDQNPFRVQFVTSNFPNGTHELWAVVTTTDGRTLETDRATLNFISADQEQQSMGRIFGILIPIILVVTLIGIGAQALAMRGTANRAPGEPRNYGLLGGAICPRCERPFPLHWWSAKLVVGRLDRCDNCGKWSLVRRAPAEVLAAAERAELARARSGESSIPGAAVEDPDEVMRRKLEQSRYTDPDDPR